MAINCSLLLIELEFGNVDFCGGRKTGVHGEKPLEQGRGPTTNLFQGKVNSSLTSKSNARTLNTQ